ncbi:MAG: hypothetical protein AAFN79_17295 [Pseudomonadota bacterium]
MFDAFEIRDVITICISVAALALSYYTAMRASRLNRRQFELSKAQGEEGSRIAAASAEAAREQARMQRDSDIIAWAGAACDLLSEMAEFSVATGDTASQIARRHKLRHQLSAKIDMGRLFFPNSLSGLERLTETGKPPAYRGQRQSVLDHLIAAYDAFSELAVTGSETERRLIKWEVTAEKRGFISEVHEFIDPRRYVEFRDDGEIAEIKEKIKAEAAEEEAGKAAQ